MNHLAHVFFAAPDAPSMIGNLAGNYFKGGLHNHPLILRGPLRVHRRVDSFTDFHPLVLACRRRLFPRLGHYGGPVLDVFFDHLLATNWQRYSEETLHIFSERAYALLAEGLSLSPEPFRSFLPRMISGNFLMRDGTEQGWRASVTRMAAEFRIAVPDEAVRAIDAHRAMIAETFVDFFPALIEEMALFQTRNLPADRQQDVTESEK